MDQIAKHEKIYVYYQGEGIYVIFSDRDSNDLGLGLLFNKEKYSGDLMGLMKYIVNSYNPSKIFDLFRQIDLFLKE